jgi:hypothetical protein
VSTESLRSVRSTPTDPWELDASKYGPSCSQHESTAGTQNMTQATLDMINSVPLFAARASDSEDASPSDRLDSTIG